MQVVQPRLIYRVIFGVIASVLVLGLPISTIAQTPESSCATSPGPLLEVGDVNELYVGRSATGNEAKSLVDLLEAYGAALEAGDPGQILALVTAEFDVAMGFSVCPELFAETGDADSPEMLLTPLRVTTDDSGTWLAFVQRSYDDGSESGYRDIFMVIAIEQDDGSVLIDFAHRDVQFSDGSSTDAQSIYFGGVTP